MHWQTKLHGLLLGATFFLLTSCERAGLLGVNLQPADQLIATSFSDTFTVQTSTIYLDTVVMQGTRRVLMGRTSDSEFGTTTAELYTQLSMGFTTDTLKFGASSRSRFDSVELILDIDYMAGQPNRNMTLEVHELAQAIDSGKTYYAFDRLPVGASLGSGTFKTSDNQFDTVRFRLNDSFGRRLFDVGGTGVFANQTNFNQFFKGIRISAPAGQDAAVVGANAFRFNTGIILHFSEPSGDSLLRREFRFAFGPRRFVGVRHDFSTSTRFPANFSNGQLLPHTALGNQAMIQDGVGLYTIVRFPHLDQFVKRRDIILNRAVLSFRPVEGSVSATNLPPSNIELYFNTPRNRVEMQSTSIGDVPKIFVDEEVTQFLARARTSFVAGGRSYTGVRITSYLDAIKRGVEQNNGIFLSPPASGSADPTISRLRFANGMPGERQIKLEIHYTVVR